MGGDALVYLGVQEVSEHTSCYGPETWSAPSKGSPAGREGVMVPSQTTREGDTLDPKCRTSDWYGGKGPSKSHLAEVCLENETVSDDWTVGTLPQPWDKKVSLRKLFDGRRINS